MGNVSALNQPLPEGGYATYSWAEFLRAVEEIAAGLRTLGVSKGDVVAIASEARAEFHVADLGVMTAGGIAAALYTAYPAAELARTIRNCDARALVAETPQLLEKIASEASFPACVPCVLLTGRSELAVSLDELRARGRKALEDDRGLLRRLVCEVRGDDPAVLYLTSGATGEPKMALVSHEAIVSNLELGPKVLGDLGPNDAMLAFLPPAHITQRLVVELLPVYCGVPVWFAESLIRLPHELARVQPTIFLAPPRLWQRVHASVRAELRSRSPRAQRLFERALALGLEAVRARLAGRRLPVWKRLQLAALAPIVFRPVRRRFGRRLRVCASGSAPLGKDLAEFFMAVGFPMIEGYGLTEAGIVVLDPPGQMRPGSIGKALPGIELRVAEDSELLVRGRTLFSGYYKDAKATAEVLKDGWLHTGDLAEIDAEGYVWITGRKKELIILSNGKKVYPSRIEAFFHVEPAVNHVLLIGDGHPYVTALITANTERLATAGFDAAARDVRKAVDCVNSKLAPFEQVRRYEVLARDFTIDSGELTATLKVRRWRAIENHAEHLKRLYPCSE